MSTTESLPQASEPATEEVDAAVDVVAAQSAVIATPASLPVAASAPQPPPLPALRAPGTELLGPLREAAGQLLPQVQYQVARLGLAGQAGLAAFAAAAAVAITALIPLQHTLQSLHAQLVSVQHPAATGGVAEAVPRLLASLPTRAQIPAVIGQVYAQAQAAGVAIDKGRYTYAPAKSGSIGRYEVEFPVAGGYPAIRTFINGTLTAVPAASLQKLRLERKAVGEQVVNADIGFVVFVRGEGQP